MKNWQKKVFWFLAGLCLGLVGANRVWADEKAAEKNTDPEVLKPGVIAGYGKTGDSRGVSIDSSSSAPGDELSLIQAGVSRIDDRKCEVKLMNTSEESRYSVRFVVEGRTSSGSKSLHRSYSASLAPGTDTVKRFNCRKDLNLSVRLTSGKKTN